MDNWDRVKAEMLTRFCAVSQRETAAQLARDRRKGDPTRYSAEFSLVLSRGEPLDPQALVGIFLANLPDGILLAVTRDGHRAHSSWHEAPTELKSIVGTRNGTLEQVQRTLLTFRDVVRRAWIHTGVMQGSGEGGKTRELRDDRGGTCYECKGRGHSARRCPPRFEMFRRTGEICRKCGGMRHYARKCPTNNCPRFAAEWRHGRHSNAGRIQRQRQRCVLLGSRCASCDEC